MPGFDGVRFVRANLAGTDFSGADLRGADFRGANLAGTIFTGALLAGAVFSPEARELPILDELQERQVIWQEGERV
ncbi:hypothetical protein EDM57_22380 [Brevibacillus gelatini]|uniref:Pentapeptide repeat-containing protein n=1 Tax=Brevibacillus gelatini TaxID=1655277 RepID=A0A3M8AKB4_9BACL|nr:pentapeptide repeat-containing protein [Brevibacillus gelatini]RNB51666.1 hypothetical protein EDM57_22380 [Brevibacillus gelatini]